MTYYKEHKWDKKFINMAKNAISAMFEEYYAPRSRGSNDRSDEEEDWLSIHLYKKRRLERKDELTNYLTADIAHHKTDPLLWWKVQLSFSTHCPLVISYTNLRL